MTKQYVLISNVAVCGFTFVANLAVAGLPSMTSLCGFGKALAFRCGAMGLEAEFAGVAVAVRAVSESQGHARYVRGMADELTDLRNSLQPDSKTASKYNAATVDTQVGTAVLDVIVALDVEDVEGFDSVAATALVRTLRLSGGELRTVSGAAVSAEVFSDRQAALARVPATAFVLEDAAATLLAYSQASGLSVPEALIDLVSRQRAPEATAPDTEDAAPATDPLEELRPGGLFVPVATGFALLEDPRPRPGSRNNLPHAFAEPIVGLARARMAAGVRAQLRRRVTALREGLDDEAPAMPAIFWRQEAHGRLQLTTAVCPKALRAF